ncbi:MAG: large conductance mechanosensitive channel protein MscL, partial [Nitriliruptoraceae bacterium]
MFAEFRAFINRGSFVDLAVGFVMGVAVTSVVQAVVGRLVMPLVGLALGGSANFDTFLTFGRATGEDGVPIGSVGAVLTSLVNFLAVGLVVFLIVRSYNRFKAGRATDEPTQEPVPEP